MWLSFTFIKKTWSLEQYLSLHVFGHKSWVIDSSPNGSLAKLSKNVLFLPSLFGVDMWISEGKAWRNWRNLFDWETVQWPLIAVSTTVAQIEIIAEPLWPLKLQQIYKHWSRKFPVQIKRNYWNNGSPFHHNGMLTRQRWVTSSIEDSCFFRKLQEMSPCNVAVVAIIKCWQLWCASIMQHHVPKCHYLKSLFGCHHHCHHYDLSHFLSHLLANLMWQRKEKHFKWKKSTTIFTRR